MLGILLLGFYENFVRSHEDFLEFPVNLKGLPILIAADPSVLNFHLMMFSNFQKKKFKQGF